MSQKDRDKRSLSGRLHFKVDAGLLVQLGEQLVARRSVALAELIKNSYDADATQVVVRLENVTQEDGQISVTDNGTGMTFEQVRDHWMRIATPDRLEHPISTVYHRARTGAKGIGRFAARRLANKLVLHSIAERQDGEKERVEVEFDWKTRFESGVTLTQIPVSYRRVGVPHDTQTGVTLLLEEVRDTWGEKDISDLQRDVFTLASPWSPQEMEEELESTRKRCTDPGFRIRLETPEFAELEGEMGEQFLSAAWGVLTGVVDSEGIPHYHLDARVKAEHVDFTPSDEVFAAMAGVRFRVHLFVYRSEHFGGFPFGVRDAQKLGREHGGVRIYLDGFRVFPYGDRGDDWLQLDEVRGRRLTELSLESASLEEEIESLRPSRPLLLTPGNNQVFGVVAISRLQHPGIEISVGRERLLENEAYVRLRRFVQLGIYWMTIQYARLTAAERERKPGLPSVVSLIDRARTSVRTLETVPASARGEILQTLDYARERAIAEKEEFISELSMLRVLSSLGAAIAVFDHQVRAIVDGTRAIQASLAELSGRMPATLSSEVDAVSAQMRTWRAMLKGHVSQLGAILGRSRRERRRHLPLRRVVNRVASPFSLYRSDFGIGFCNDVPSRIRTPLMYEAELHAILLHALTNSLKAVRQAEVREVSISARKDDDGLHIFVLDTGIGIEPERREAAFLPFETTSVPDPILGEGTGLGLKVVRDILETYQGTARFIDVDQQSGDEPDWVTCLEILVSEGDRS